MRPPHASAQRFRFVALFGVTQLESWNMFSNSLSAGERSKSLSESVTKRTASGHSTTAGVLDMRISGVLCICLPISGSTTGGAAKTDELLHLARLWLQTLRCHSPPRSVCSSPPSSLAGVKRIAVCPLESRPSREAYTSAHQFAYFCARCYVLQKVNKQRRRSTALLR